MGKKVCLVLVLFVGLFLIAPVGVLADDLGLTAEQQSFYSQMLRTFVAPDFCGKSMEDCPAKITVDMRNGILEQVKDGASKDEIIAYWTSVYGERILAAPPKSGFFLSAWVLPIIGILLGIFILSMSLKGRMGGKERLKSKKAMAPGEYEEELQQEILKHL